MSFFGCVLLVCKFVFALNMAFNMISALCCSNSSGFNFKDFCIASEIICDNSLNSDFVSNFRDSSNTA